MYKKFDMLAVAGKWWSYFKLAQNSHAMVQYLASEIVDTLKSVNDEDNSVIHILHGICIAASAAENYEKFEMNALLQENINTFLDCFGYNKIEGDILEYLGGFDKDDVLGFVNLVVDNRETLEPKFGEWVVGLIFLTAILQTNDINKEVYDFACMVADDEFDHVPSYEDFLLDF